MLTRQRVEAILKRERVLDEDTVLHADKEKMELCEALLELMEDTSEVVLEEEE